MVALLYTNNDLSEREIKKKEKKTISFTIASKRIQYLRINLTKEVKDLYSENYKTLMKETEDKTNEGKYIPCSWIARIIGNIRTTQSHLQILCNPCQNNNDIFLRTGTIF